MTENKLKRTKNQTRVLQLKSLEKSEENLILAIETAVEGGSFALFAENGRLIDARHGKTASRGEDAIERLEESLKKHALDKRRIKLIAVSNGPGSFTGARIGAATAKGLARALSCDISARSILESMVFNFVQPAAFNDKNNFNKGKDTDSKILTAIPFGRERVCVQGFLIKIKKGAAQIISLKEPTAESFSSLRAEAEAETKKYDEIILHEILYGRITPPPDTDAAHIKIINAGGNLAKLLGKQCIAEHPSGKNNSSLVSPIYVRS